MIKYNGNNAINDWNYGTSNLIKVYRNNAIVYYKVSGESPTPQDSGNVITYTASAKLLETTTVSSGGLHTYAFSGTSGQLTITSHTFSNGVGTIVFNGDVKRVGTYAFFKCSGATSITIPSSVSVFENQPFWGCISLTDITIKATTAPTFNGFVFDNTNNCNINVPCNSLVDYASVSMFFNYGLTSRLKGISPCTNKVRYYNSGTTCHNYDLYQVVALQLSTDNGSTWSYVSPAVTQEYLLEENSEDCGYVPPTPTPSYSGQYLTFVATESGTFKFSGNSIDYSLDNGNTWTTLESDTDSPTVTSGSKIMWKAELTPLQSLPYGIGTFSSTANFTVEGNPMSLLYGDNFIGVTDLTGNDYAFYKLFKDCSGLTSAENLSLLATTLANNCYYSMFDGCTSLTTAPELPATTLASSCCQYMFDGCTALTTAPSLPATTLADSCYRSMFSSCSSLTTAPVINATTLSSYCCYGMFSKCTSLTTAPELLATTLTDYCYERMFMGCTSLVTAPVIDATTIPTETSGSCRNMFSGCTSLTTSPVLSAATLANFSYRYMFKGCTSLSSIKCLATDISAKNCTNGWVNGVAANGTFTKAASMTSWTTGNNGIPSGWTVVDASPSYSGQYLTFVATESGTFKFSGNSVDYSLDSGNTWTTLESDTDSPTVASGSKIMWKAELTPTRNGIGRFSSTANFTVEGNPMSLLYGDNFIGVTDLTGKDYALYGLFSDCTGMTSAENLSLPATTLVSHCYDSMFRGCTSLTTAPSLPATTLADSCYKWMFGICTSLSSITCLATNISATNCTAYWTISVAASGTFTKAASMTSWTSGFNGIPSGWSVEDATS